MNRNTLHKPQVIIILTVIVLLLAGSAAAAYTALRKPDEKTSSTQQVDEEPAKSATKEDETKTPPAPEKYTLSLVTKLKTKEQGNCELTMTNGERTLTKKNSTIGVKDKTGCLEWKLDTSDFPAGKYDVTVKFVGETSEETTKQTIDLPALSTTPKQ